MFSGVTPTWGAQLAQWISLPLEKLWAGLVDGLTEASTVCVAQVFCPTHLSLLMASDCRVLEHRRVLPLSAFYVFLQRAQCIPQGCASSRLSSKTWGSHCDAIELASTSAVFPVIWFLLSSWKFWVLILEQIWHKWHKVAAMSLWLHLLYGIWENHTPYMGCIVPFFTFLDSTA